MLQTIVPAKQKQSKSAQIGQALSAGLGTFLEKGQQKENDKKLSELLGFDISGFSPEMKQEAFKQAMQSKLEMMKQQGDINLQNQKQSQFDKILGGYRENNALGKTPGIMPEKREMPSFLDRLQGQGQENPQESYNDQIQDENHQFDPSLLSDEDIARIGINDKETAKLLQQQKEAKIEERRKNKEFNQKVKESSPEYKRDITLSGEQAKVDIDYNKHLQEQDKRSEEISTIVNKAKGLNKKGVTGKWYEQWLEGKGMFNQTSPERRELSSLLKDMMKGVTREVLGSQFTQFEFKTILDSFFSPNFTQETNNRLLDNIEMANQIKRKEVEIARDLKKENKGKIPEDYESKINERMKPYYEEIGEKLKENAKYTMYDEFKVPPGKVLMFDDDQIAYYINPDEVEQAQEDGLIPAN